ncbi:SCO6745 family protein [Mycolicibacterium sp.]|uniref:SCO6745 family protein n=1 Tax=Mycolicibacterium sp. TaxID=2320850 RepID=UPI003D146120
MHRSPTLARRFFNRFEPVHAVTYFAPEARSALDDLGYRGFWMGYFAARSAPFGVVPTELVVAAFYNFAPERVAKALPAAWDIAPPATALRARETAAVAALRRYGVTDAEAAEAADLAAKAAAGADPGGRALYAANRALDWPEEPLARLWHATTLLREHRGDGHIAALLAEGISGRESNVLHAAAGRVPEEMIKRSRDYDDALWEQHAGTLRRRGLLDEEGALTQAGRALKQRIEDATDALAVPALTVLDDDEVEALFRVLTPITRKVVAGGDIPVSTPMGLDRTDLGDDRAHLR